MKQARKMMLPVIVKGSGNTPPIVRELVNAYSKLLFFEQPPLPSFLYPEGH
jgi:hypothetical protein